MQFKITSVVGLLATITPALASTPLLEEIQQITLAAVNVGDIFQSTEFVNMFQRVPAAINTYNSEILKAKAKMISNFPSSLEAADQAALCEDYVTFATASEDLMNDLVRKHGMIKVTPFKAPVGAILRQDEALTDTLSTNVVGVVPSCADKIQDPKQKLEKAYKNAVTTYES